ncbi:MAG: sulfotransferase [Gammaproteobacteria bacterium]
MSTPPRDDGFQVSKWVDAVGGFISRNQSLWIKIGNWETRLLADALADVRVQHPIYVTGLARSGSTILLEMLAEFEGTVTHRYKDYPPVFTPYYWNWFLDRMPKSDAKPAERTHRDGIMVTPDSPEAFEEVLWMAFFPDAHDAARSSVLDHTTADPAFEAFYRDHIRKLLAIRNGNRYLSKGNYNVTRLEYLLKIFPDARFVIPIREPSWHIASLMKQHTLLSDGQRRNPRALEHMRRVGHFEFGLDRRAINAGDPACVEQVASLWEQGKDTEGWAHYWSHIYGFVADRLEHNPQLKAATLTVRFEDLCREPENTIQAVLDHCRLPKADRLVSHWIEKIHAPSYYKPDFSDQEFEMIDRLTQPVAERFGYTEPGLRRFKGCLN